MKIPSKPNFFIVGAQKAGTTALWHFLRQHPQIFMPDKVKEPCFFRGDPSDYDVGPRISLVGTQEADAYLALFSKASDEVAIGEASTDYLYYAAKTARNIDSAIPEARIIIVLRDPVERAYSNYVWALKECVETEQDFQKALNLEKTRIADQWGSVWHYQAKGYYFEQVKSYFDTFGRASVAVYLYEDFQRDASSVCRDIFGFLGVNDDFEPNTSKRSNASGVPKSVRLQKMLRNSSSITKLGFLLPKHVRRRARSAFLKLNTTTDKSKLPAFQSELQTSLRSNYRADILKLQQLIQRDLSGWLT